MKKQLSVLAASILVAANSHSISLGSNILGVFSNDATSSSYVMDLGVSAEDFAAGTGFSFDISSADSALGDITSFSVVGSLPGSGTPSPLADGFTPSLGNGLVYASDQTQSAISNNTLINTINAVNTFLANVTALNTVSTGGGYAGANGTFVSAAFSTGLINTGSASVFSQTTQFPAPTSLLTQVDITSPTSALAGVNLVGNTFSATGLATANPIPVPAAAWLFGSALVALGAVRRKK